MPQIRDQEEPAKYLPVRSIPGDPATDAAEDGIALCLSGGGYRAMLFHLGALWRLHEIGLLPRISRISSVSGGSITAAALALKWAKLQHDATISNFKDQVVQPVMELASHTIDIPSILIGLFLPGGVSKRIAIHYRKYLFGHATLEAFPDTPLFVLNATNLQSGVLWRFTKPFMGDYRVGMIEQHPPEVAVAVGASSAFPPVLSPVILKFKEVDYKNGTGMDLKGAAFRKKVYLTDGGVYDNLGLETAYKKYRTVLVSDGGAKMGAESRPKRDWLLHTLRVLGIIDNQVGSLRKRSLIAAYEMGQRTGTYWGIGSDMARYAAPGALPCPGNKTLALAALPTRLKSMPLLVQQRLINWGYAICDAAIRKHYDPSVTAPQKFPYPSAGVG
jgi:NTE family protein